MTEKEPAPPPPKPAPERRDNTRKDEGRPQGQEEKVTDTLPPPAPKKQ